VTTEARSRRNPVRKGDVRERAILETAERLLAQRPLAEITIDDLTAGAGISRSSFYFYFASKDDVLITLVERVVTDLRTLTDALLERLHDDPRAQIEQGIAATVNAWSEHRALMNAAIDAWGTVDPLRRMWSAVLERFAETTATAIQAERDRGTAPPTNASPAELATVLHLLNERCLYMTFAGIPPSLSEQRITAVLTETWLRTIYTATTNTPPDRANDPSKPKQYARTRAKQA
jgi:TetR/AcrR family transcriptional regulator, ethionamide resistance regulator